MANISEIREKERRARDMMAREGLHALAISTIHNFAWLTCGGSNYVGIAAEVGAATAVITGDAKYIVCDNIEAGRITDEEIAGQDFEIKSYPWHDNKRDDIIREIAGGGRLGSDIPMDGAVNVSSLIDPLRFSLTPEEIERYRLVGKVAGECIENACREIEPGMTEHEIAAILDRKLFANGMTPNVTLIAVDERIRHYRHPLPTDRKLEKMAMLVTGARKWGLIASVTRLVSFGPLSPEIEEKHEAVTRIDAAFIANTKIGASVGNIFKTAQRAYAETGFPDEWQLHHQGGPTGYKGREFRATAESTAIVRENQAFAWNPSITGTKSEDTIIAASNGTEIISQTGNWPVIEVEIDGAVIKRPDILIR